MRFQILAWVLGLAGCQQVMASNMISDTENHLPGYCQDVSQTIQETYFELPRDLPTAKAALCALAELVSELEDEEQERPPQTLQSRQSIAIGCGCDLWNPEGCGCGRFK